MEKDFFAKREKLLPKGYNVSFNSIKSGKGSKIINLDGREIIDFVSGIGVMSLGHSSAPVLKATKEQINKFTHSCFGIISYEIYLELVEKLINLFPHDETGTTKAILTNTGGEAVENAIKIARIYTKRSGIIAFSNAFHGRTYMAAELTDKAKGRKHCGPFPTGVFRLGFPSYFHYGRRLNQDVYIQEEIENLKNFFYHQINAEEIAAVILELVQGEGGFNVMPKPYLIELKKLCEEFKIVLIFDEIQSGFGKTGKWAAYQHYNILPDLSVWAKAMGSGFPIGAVIGKGEIMDSVPVGIFGGTYSGNPVSCAAAIATLNHMKEINLPQMAEVRGELILNKLNTWQQEFDFIADTRGLGMMRAIEFCNSGDPRQPLPQVTRQFIKDCYLNGLLLLGAGQYNNCIRILCPLNIEIETLEEGLLIMEKEFRKFN